MAISDVVETISSAAAATVRARLSVTLADSAISLVVLLMLVKFSFNLASAPLIAPTMPCHSTRILSNARRSVPKSSFKFVRISLDRSPFEIADVATRACLIAPVNTVAREMLTTTDRITTNNDANATATIGPLEFSSFKFAMILDRIDELILTRILFASTSFG